MRGCRRKARQEQESAQHLQRRGAPTLETVTEQPLQQPGDTQPTGPSERDLARGRRGGRVFAAFSCRVYKTPRASERCVCVRGVCLCLCLCLSAACLSAYWNAEHRIAWRTWKTTGFNTRTRSRTTIEATLSRITWPLPHRAWLPGCSCRASVAAATATRRTPQRPTTTGLLRRASTSLAALGALTPTLTPTHHLSLLLTRTLTPQS